MQKKKISPDVEATLRKVMKELSEKMVPSVQKVCD